MTESNGQLRPRPAILRALGEREPPTMIVVGGVSCTLVELFKHDSWAATALYEGAHGMVVVKFDRQQSLFGLPMGWLGRWLARREARALDLLGEVPGVPPNSGEVWVDGRHWRSAVAHPYIEGHPLHMDERPGDAFFLQLEEIVREMHRRGMAYVDLNKRENIIVSLDGSPVLVDFQLYFAPAPWVARLPSVRWLLTECQRGDLHHLRKHLRWHRPDLVSKNEADVVPRGARIWRWLYVRPVQFVRRHLLVWLRVRSGRGFGVSELEPEKAARLALARRSGDPTARLPGESGGESS